MYILKNLQYFIKKMRPHNLQEGNNMMNYQNMLCNKFKLMITFL